MINYFAIPGLPKLSPPDSVIFTVAEVWGISPAELISPSRELRFVLPRHMAAAILYTHLGLTYNEIAELLGRRNHATILHSVRAFQAAMAYTPGYAAKYHTICKHLQIP